MEKNSKLGRKDTTRQVRTAGAQDEPPKLASERSKGTDQRGKQGLTVGIDLGDKYSRFCVLDGDGEVISEGQLRTHSTALQAHFDSLSRARVALEAGAHSGWVSRLLERCGHEVLVANARELRKVHQNDHKNDRADAEILARLARFDPRLLQPIQHRSADAQADLGVIRARDALIRARTQLINAARGLVKNTGRRLSPCSAEAFARRVGEEVPAELRPAVMPLINEIASLTEKIQLYDKQVEKLAREKYPETALLKQVSGVGYLTSLAYVLTLEDKERFTKSRDVGPYLGLVPKQSESGESSPQLRITKAGNGHLRRLLVGSAQHILGPFGRDTNLRRYGLRLAERGGKNAKKRAVVAVARKLAVLLHRLWVTAEVYEPLHQPALTQKEVTAA